MHRAWRFDSDRQSEREAVGQQSLVEVTWVLLPAGLLDAKATPSFYTTKKQEVPWKKPKVDP